MTEYSAEILETNKELTAKERIRLKDTSDCIKLDVATVDGEVVITPVAYAVLGIHNEKSEDKDYKVYVIEDENGTKYVTGSESFFTAFKDIYDEMDGENEAWQIKAYRLPSKNYANKEFITCSII